MQTGSANLPPVIGSQPPASRSGRAWFIAAAVAAAGCAVLFLFNPTQHAFYPFCLFYKYTGLQCPGCGSLRATHELLHGNIMAALRLNVLFVIAVFAAPVYIAYCLLKGKKPGQLGLSTRFIWISMAVMVVFGILRNIPNGPLSKLF